MPVERRDAQDVAQGRNAPAICADGWLKGYARLHWIHSACVEEVRCEVAEPEASLQHAQPDAGIPQAGRVQGRWSRPCDEGRQDDRHHFGTRSWAETQPEEPYARIGHVRFWEGPGRIGAQVYSMCVMEAVTNQRVKVPSAETGGVRSGSRYRIGVRLAVPSLACSAVARQPTKRRQGMCRP